MIGHHITVCSGPMPTITRSIHLDVFIMFFHLLSFTTNFLQEARCVFVGYRDTQKGLICNDRSPKPNMGVSTKKMHVNNMHLGGEKYKIGGGREKETGKGGRWASGGGELLSKEREREDKKGRGVLIFFFSEGPSRVP